MVRGTQRFTVMSPLVYLLIRWMGRASAGQLLLGLVSWGQSPSYWFCLWLQGISLSC